MEVGCVQSTVRTKDKNDVVTANRREGRVTAETGILIFYICV